MDDPVPSNADAKVGVAAWKIAADVTEAVHVWRNALREEYLGVWVVYAAVFPRKERRDMMAKIFMIWFLNGYCNLLTN